MNYLMGWKTLSKCPEDLEKIKNLEREYFSDEKGEDYVMEIIGDGVAVAKKDITEMLKG